MKSTRVLASASETWPFGITAVITPGWKPVTISLSGSMIDSSRYASSALTVWPFVSFTLEPKRPLNVGPLDGDPSSE